MFNSRYSKILTVILIVVIIGIVGIVGYFVYDTFVVKARNNKAQEIVDKFTNTSVRREFETNPDNKDENGSAENPLSSLNSVETGNVQQPEKTYMEGYEVMGTIEIPKTGANYPILEDPPTKRSLEIAVAILYGEGLNQPGNTTIVGHNYRNGLFFSDNKKLSKGDIIKITDQTGTTITYSIYDMFETTSSDADYMLRDTGGAREISLSTCTDDSVNRLIILAREK